MRESSRANSGDLKACLLLAGSLTPSPLIERTGGTVLDLFLNGKSTVMGLWLDRFQELVTGDSTPPDIRIVHSLTSPPPSNADIVRRGFRIAVLADRQEFRGPAGAVKDASLNIDGDASMLVAEAARFFDSPLTPIVAEHFSKGSDVTVVANTDRSPAGVFLIRRRWLDIVPDIGFMDLKEQWLSKVAEQGAIIRVHQLQTGNSYGLRTREEFLDAARTAGGLFSTINSSTVGVDKPAKPRENVRAVVEGISIGPDAVIVDSVVMPGSQVGAGAVVARSLICPFGLVHPGATVVDAVVPPAVRLGEGGGGLGVPA